MSAIFAIAASVGLPIDVPATWQAAFRAITWSALISASLCWLVAHVEFLQKLRSARFANNIAMFAIIFVFGGSLAVLFYNLSNRHNHKSDSDASDVAIDETTPAIPFVGGIGGNRVPLSQRAQAAQEAIDHYNKTSQTLHKEEIQKGYKDYCDKIAAKVSKASSQDWIEIEGLGRLVSGDTASSLNPRQPPRMDLEGKYPGTAWAMIRIGVSFGTAESALTHTSYVLVTRTHKGNEIVALFTDERQLTILSEGSDAASHEKLITDTAQTELDRLTDKIIPEIKALP